MHATSRKVRNGMRHFRLGPATHILTTVLSLSVFPTFSVAPVRLVQLCPYN